MLTHSHWETEVNHYMEFWDNHPPDERWLPAPKRGITGFKRREINANS